MSTKSDISNKKTVAIIGAGPSGLCSLKSSLENGLEPTLFEKGSNIGGLWSRDKSLNKMWDSMIGNNTKYTMSFSDFPIKMESDELSSLENMEKKLFQPHSKVCEYLQDYTNHFGLSKYIKFNTNINQIKRVKTTNKQGELLKWELNNDKLNLYDYLIVSTGAFSKPQDSIISNNLLSNGYKGEISLAENYKNNEKYIGKKVVVLGTSFSACEIASEISKVTLECIQVGHDNKWVIPRCLPNPNYSIEEGGDKVPEYIPFEVLFFNRNRVSSRKNIDLKTLYKEKNQTLSNICEYQNKLKTPNSLIPVEINDNPVHSIISSCYINSVKNDKIKIFIGNGYTIDSTVSCSGNSITFVNEKGDRHTEDNVDEIILCNGYKLDLSFFEQDILNEIEFKQQDSLQPLILYKNMLPKSNDNLAFIGLFRGLYFGQIELFSRWATMIFSGQLQYPNLQVIETDLEIQRLKRNDNTNNSPNYRPQFLVPDYISYCDELASIIGCLPNFNQIKETDPQLYDMLWNGYFCNASYRLTGNNSNPTLAKEIISNYYKIHKTFLPTTNK